MTGRTSSEGYWLIDGHNVIYQSRNLRRLQENERKRDARDRLASWCRHFACEHRVYVVLFFDGGEVPGAPGAEAGPHLEVTFGDTVAEADDLIVNRAERLRREKRAVTVVTDDGGIRRRLPHGATSVGVEEFRRSCTPRRDKTEEKPKVTDPDIRAHFLAADAPDAADGSSDPGPHKPPSRGDRYSNRRRAAEAPLPDSSPSTPRAPRPDGGAGSGTPLRDLVPLDPPRKPAEDPAEARRRDRERKKERGRRKQERRLAARSTRSRAKRRRR